MSNETALEAVIAKLHQIPQHLRDAYHLKIGCAAAREQLTATAMQSARWGLGTVICRANVNRSTVGDALDCASQLTSLWVRRSGGFDEIATIARLNALEQILASDPATAEAVAVLEPLCQERDRLVAQIEADRIAHAEAHADADRAHAAAVARALESAKSDPEVAKARAALAKFEPAEPSPDLVLTRGKIPVGKRDENLLEML